MRSWLAVCCLTVAVMSCGGEPAPADAMSRPARPKSFASPDDLKMYLDQLGQYYAVAGRPRFGKRTIGHAGPKYHLPLETVNYRYNIPEPSDLYDIIYQPVPE